jgi:hypothetical protein
VAAKKNSLVNNINRRKRAGTSRPKSRSTVSSAAYDRMESGWPAESKKKTATSKKRATPAKGKAKAT